MEKEIKREIVIGAVLMILVIIGGFIWLEIRQRSQIQSATQALKDQVALTLSARNFNKNNASVTGSNVQVPIQYEERTPVIAGLQMALPDDWIIASKTEDKNYVFTLKSSPKDALVLSVTKNNADDIKNFKDERKGSDYTNITGGEIFKFTGCGTGLEKESCNGAIVGSDVYSFLWTFRNNVPIRENQKSPEPPQGLDEETIWNLLKAASAG